MTNPLADSGSRADLRSRVGAALHDAHRRPLDVEPEPPATPPERTPPEPPQRVPVDPGPHDPLPDEIGDPMPQPIKSAPRGGSTLERGTTR